MNGRLKLTGQSGNGKKVELTIPAHNQRPSRPPTRMAVAIVAALMVIFPSYADAQERPVFRIGILVDRVIPEMSPMMEQFKAEVSAVVGQDAEVRFPPEMILVNDFDRAKARSDYQKLMQSDVNLVFAFGPINGEIVTAQPRHLKPTILFGAVNRDLVDLDESEGTSGIDNFTYLISAHSYAEDLEVFKSLYPFKRVGVVVLGPQAEWPSVAEALDRAVKTLDAEYEIIPYVSLESLAQSLDSVDAVYMAEGFGISRDEMDAMANLLIERRIPSFTNTQRSDVERGWLATTQGGDNFGQFTRRIALMVEAVVNGASLSEMAVAIDQTQLLTINYNTAERVGVPIRHSLLGSADLVGDFGRRVSEERYDLRSVVDRALERNLSLQASRVDLSLARQDLRDARSAFLPTLTTSATGTYTDPELAKLSGGQNPEYSTSGNVTLRQTLYSEAARANAAIQKSLLDAEREDLDATELDLVFDAAQLYFNLLSLKSNVQIQKQNLDATRSHLRIATQNFEAGQTGEADQLRFRSEMARNMRSLIDAVNDLEQGFQFMNVLLGDPVDRKIDVIDVASPEGVYADHDFEGLKALLDDPAQRDLLLDFLVEEALRNAPELASLDYSLTATDRNIRLYGPRRFIPSVAAQAQYNRTFDQSGAGALPDDVLLKDNYFAGVTLSIPIFDGAREHINRQKGVLRREQLELTRKGLTLAIEQGVRGAVLELAGELAGLDLARISSDAARRSLELTEASYSAGAVAVVQLIDAQNNYLQAQLAQSNATYGFLSSAIALEREVGQFSLLAAPESGESLPARFLRYLNRTQSKR